jgi:cysteine-rich repeat protein
MWCKLTNMRMYFAILGIMLLWFSSSAHGEVLTYSDETSYLNDLASFGFGTLQEGFEDDAAWGNVRFPDSVPEVSSQGILWTANNDNSGVSTNSGPARSGLWAFRARPHGITTGAPLTPQRDGFIGTSASTIFGVGGWLNSNTGGAQIRFVLDGNAIDFADSMVTSIHKFFGVIDTAGFAAFEVVETEGTVEDQEFIFADDFTIGTPVVAGCGNGTIEAGELCDDGNLLNGDCCSSTCRFEQAGGLCPDGQFCNGEETCDGAGACMVGPPVDCSDGVGCTDDVCDELSASCTSTPNDFNCSDDGLFCTGAEFCDAQNDCSSSGDPCPTGTVCNDGPNSCDAIAACGNGILELGEECDDSNTLDGDCCSSLCVSEPAGSLCADGQFCNGEETCDGAGACLAGLPVGCDDGIGCTVDACDEVSDSCVATSNDNNCTDDGLFCNGQEICDPIDGCLNTGSPCGPGETCNEATSTCEFSDLDIVGFRATKRVSVQRVKPIRLTLTVKNPGTLNDGATSPAAVVGEQNGEVVFSETQAVFDSVGNGRTKFEFGPFRPTAAGDIIWTATVVDGNPDDDTAMATTRVAQ